jgi:ribosome hibernation promoting factor
MKTQVSILHHDYPGRVREIVDAKLQGLTRFFGRLVSVRANLERENEDHHVELVADLGKGGVLVAVAKGDAFRSTLDEAVDRMSSQLRKHRDKQIDRHRRS